MKIKYILNNSILFNRFWFFLKSRKQDRIIRKEQEYYESRAKKRGIPIVEQNPSETYEQLLDRLDRRGIIWPHRTGGRRLHILYASVPTIWESHNLLPELSKVAELTTYFAEERGIKWKKYTPSQMRQLIDADFFCFVEKIHQEEPIDMLLSYLPGTRISPKTVNKINSLGIPTFSFNFDDRISFRGSLINGQWTGPAGICTAFDLNLTNSPASLIKYRDEGALSLFWPEGANPKHFSPQNVSFDYDVSFIGSRYGVRPKLINYLKKHGITVECFGEGWDQGPISAREMVDVYARSKINLGFGYIGYSSYQCLKGRDFEVPMCGALYLTSHNEDLLRVYKLGEDIETYHSFEDCLRKVKFLLDNPDRCALMRESARRTCLKKHTWAKRIMQLISPTLTIEDN